MLEVGRQHLLSSLHLSWNRNVIVQAVANNFNVLLKCFSVSSPVNTFFFFKVPACFHGSFIRLCLTRVSMLGPFDAAITR